MSWSTTTGSLAGWDPWSWDPLAKLHLAQVARLAYMDPRDLDEEGGLQKVVQRAGYNRAEFISVRGAQAMVLVSDEWVIIASRGTSGPLDVVHDLMSIITRPWRSWIATVRERCVGSILPPAIRTVNQWSSMGEGRSWNGSDKPQRRVGWGFRIQASRLVPRLVGTLRSIQGIGSKKIVLIGHSLGGSLAEILAAELDDILIGMQAAFEPFAVVCFAPPRTGNREFVTTTLDDIPVWYVGGSHTGPGGVPAPDLVMRVPLRRWRAHIHRFEVPERALLALLTDDGPKHTIEEWQEYRRSHPTTVLAALRIVSRIRAEYLAHSLDGLVERLAGGVQS